MTERQLFDALLVAMVFIAAAVAVVLLFITAPYGRHTRRGWGPGVRRSIGWLLMEAPPVLVVAACFALGDRHTDVVALVFLALWMSHYLHRDLVYPWRMRATDRRMPWLVVGMGVVFNLANGYLQGRWLFSLGPRYELSWLWDPRFLIGTTLFVAGYGINQHADAVLRRLGRSGSYGIPHGGAYRWVSCPNYLGELVEWIGWAVLTWSIPGLVFAIWTAANLVPRARSNHRWYLERFDHYPADRKALIPYVF